MKIPWREKDVPDLNKQFQALCKEAQSDTANWQDVVGRAIAQSDARLKNRNRVGAQQFLMVAALCSDIHGQTELAIEYIQKALKIGADPTLDLLLESFRQHLDYRRELE